MARAGVAPAQHSKIIANRSTGGGIEVAFAPQIARLIASGKILISGMFAASDRLQEPHARTRFALLVRFCAQGSVMAHVTHEPRHERHGVGAGCFSGPSLRN